jgi:hypothetical protein
VVFHRIPLNHACPIHFQYTSLISQTLSPSIKGKQGATVVDLLPIYIGKGKRSKAQLPTTKMLLIDDRVLGYDVPLFDGGWWQAGTPSFWRVDGGGIGERCLGKCTMQNHFSNVSPWKRYLPIGQHLPAPANTCQQLAVPNNILLSLYIRIYTGKKGKR